MNQVSHPDISLQENLQADLKQLPISVETFGTKFDVVLIDPPWEEYGRRAPGISDFYSWTWQEIRDLELERITEPPSFVFLWWGSDHLSHPSLFSLFGRQIHFEMDRHHPMILNR